jgi:predicted transcriptional regulator
MKKISPSERSIMVYLWMEEEAGRGGKAFSDIFSAMGEGVAKQTVNTFLLRLAQKGYLTHEGLDGKRLYYPQVSRTEYAFSLLRDVFPDMTDEKEDVLLGALSYPYENHGLGHEAYAASSGI